MPSASNSGNKVARLSSCVSVKARQLFVGTFVIVSVHSYNQHPGQIRKDLQQLRGSPTFQPTTKYHFHQLDHRCYCTQNSSEIKDLLYLINSKSNKLYKCFPIYINKLRFLYKLMHFLRTKLNRNVCFSNILNCWKNL